MHKNNTFLEEFKYPIAFWAFVFLNLLVSYCAAEIVRYIAIHITDSLSFKDCNYCSRFHWDLKLKVASYLLYLAIFIGVVLLVTNLMNKSNIYCLKNKILFILFALSFPSVTHWPVERITYGLWGLSSYDFHHLLVPTIMSNNPLFIGVSFYVAYRVAIFYTGKVS